MFFKILPIMLLVSSIAYGQTTTPLTYPLNDAVKKVCNNLEDKFKAYKWGEAHCEYFDWINVRKTNAGTPLIWTAFGEEKSPAAANTTLVLCGVHGDEITPVKFCWDLMRELKSNHTFHNKMVVVAPLVSPDSFFKLRPTRTNAAGVDVNRNFPTKDFKSDAYKRWINTYRRDKRKYPGPYANSEQETLFQMNLILRYKPNKIITVHAPLTLLDYDGPSLRAEAGKTAKQVLEQMSEKSAGYKVSNYPIFPGSLGNWAGKEKHIPTYTLELPNSNPLESDKFWLLFKDAVIYAIEHPMKPTVD
ncbi:MAG: succinylglutamate desuccinylase/aspartoacylase family protein [Bacteriovoracaceae bacterium]|nr:succinylglutamate desuccinylase/aspartoacylase family protein [Bacteriovoracaceae bacterium]